MSLIFEPQFEVYYSQAEHQCYEVGQDDRKVRYEKAVDHPQG